MKHTPALDPGFIPLGIWMESYQKGAQKPVAVAVERNNGYISVFRTHIHGTKDMLEADYRYPERYVKFLLWSVGGFRIYVCGCSELAPRAGIQVMLPDENTRRVGQSVAAASLPELRK